jgi:hypothetical protein
MKSYQTKAGKLSGTSWAEVYKKALRYYEQIRKHTKRRPYIKSPYFNKEKVFLDIYWKHLHEKQNLKDKTRRVKYFVCAIELVQNTRFSPASKENPNKRSEILHRFAGTTKDNEIFFVQIRENRRTGQKDLMSTFPLDK